MNREFVDYKTAVDLKELGFDEPCWAWWHIEDCDTRFCYSEQRSPIINSRETEIVGLPLYQQAFRWFREKHGMHHTIQYDGKEYIAYTHNYHKTTKYKFNTYEEAEQACLDKLIEIVKKDEDTTR